MKQNIVGKRIIRLCADRNVSVEDLAAEVGMELSQMEKIIYSDIIPSLTPLVKIARVLGVRIGTFLDDNNKLGPAIQRKGELQESLSVSGSFSNANLSLDFFSLASQKAGRNMEPFIINVHPASEPQPILSSHEGEEFIYILQGELKVHYGKETFDLKEGDSIYFDSIVNHLVEAKGGEIAKILAVLYTPM